MSVFKIEKTKDFTVMSNHHLRDKNLSLKARGLLSYMLSLPDDWDYSLAGLVANCKESVTSVRSALEELKQYRYLIIDKLYPNVTESKKIEYVYNIYEQPKLQELYNQDTENLYLENDTQLNTNKQITNKQIDKDDKTKISPFFVSKEHNRFTLELINTKYINENDSQIYYYDDLFEKLLEDNSYSDLMTMIHYIVPRVISNKFKDEDGKEIKNKFGYFKNAINQSI